MAPLHIKPHRVAPYLLSGASGVHILARMWRLSKLPASEEPLHVFLLKNSDIIFALTGGTAVWIVAQRRRRPEPALYPQLSSDQSIVLQVVDQLRQVFTALLLGLGLIQRKTRKKQLDAIPPIVERLQNVVVEGIQAVNVLDPPQPFGSNGREQ